MVIGSYWVVMKSFKYFLGKYISIWIPYFNILNFEYSFQKIFILNYDNSVLVKIKLSNFKT